MKKKNQPYIIVGVIVAIMVIGLYFSNLESLAVAKPTIKGRASQSPSVDFKFVEMNLVGFNSCEQYALSKKYTTLMAPSPISYGSKKIVFYTYPAGRSDDIIACFEPHQLSTAYSTNFNTVYTLRTLLG